MDANRLSNEEAIQAIKNNYPPENYTILREALDMAMDLLKNADHQQSEIDRLTRAYEVLREALDWELGYAGSVNAGNALDEAQRIKDGEQS